MNIKIQELELNLLQLKNDYKKALDETMPGILERIKVLEHLEKRIKNLETDLKKLSSSDYEKKYEFVKENEDENVEQSCEKNNEEINQLDLQSVWDFKGTKKTPEIFIFILNRIKSLLGPLESLFQTIGNFYMHYKNQGKGPVFLMTLAGIIALVLGFSYLIQYSFSNFFNEWTKIALVFSCGFGLIYGSGRLYYKKEFMRDYASGLIGLGIIINYLAIYGAGPFYHIINSAFAFLLLILNTLFALFLSVRFTTRVVSFIAMTGGIFFPLALGSGGESTSLYLSYLFTLCLMTMFVADKIKWKVLAYLTIVLSLFMIETTASVSLFQLALIHLFFYLYFYFLLFEEKRIKNILIKKELIILSALFVWFIKLIITLSYSKEVAGLVLGINSILFACLFFRFIQKNIKSFVTIQLKKNHIN